MPYADPAMKRERDRQYKAERRGLLAEKQRDYYQRTRAERDRTSAAWAAANWRKTRAIRFVSASNKRAARLGATERLSVADLSRLDAGPCSYCMADCESWDHIVPLASGGRNHVSNLTPCCLPCNFSKQTKPLLVWLLWRKAA